MPHDWLRKPIAKPLFYIYPPCMVDSCMVDSASIRLQEAVFNRDELC